MIDRINEGIALQKAIKQEINANKKRKQRLNHRIKIILEEPHAYLITLTIKDQYYGKAVVNYIRRIRTKVFREFEYVMNEDYGSKEKRLHFHLVLASDKRLKYKIYVERWKWGAINFQKINNKDCHALRNYLQKLQNHAIKQSTGRIFYHKKPIDKYANL